MSEFNTPVSCEQVSPSRIAPADAVKNGVAYLLAGLGVFGIVEGAQLIVGFVWGVGFAPFGLLDFSLETSRPYSTPALSMPSRSRSC